MDGLPAHRQSRARRWLAWPTVPAAVVAVVAVVGPTATGKSDLAVELALALDGEVVNADASQLYRGMDVGTAKLPLAERRGVPHHLLDVLDVRQEARVAAYQRAARAALADVVGRGRTAVLVGGSGLYVRAALDELDFPETDPAVRARLEAELEAAGPGGETLLRTRLAALDPTAEAAITRGNVRRLVRALEVVEVTGRPFSASMPQRRYSDAVSGLGRVVQVGLRADREVLRERIATRVADMERAGLVEEVAQLAEHGLREGVTASRALGYAQLLDALDGRCTVAEALEATVHGTRRYARRQLSWFGADPRVQWLDTDALHACGGRAAVVQAALRLLA
ncbi:tRNA dimethylallyltransferase [Quadrisphaera granulorum]|uniref:tRNA dimethylallyltransferase n=1 Tax=Quadrisphaera granulorum TaxID=317664 RepID=A0A316A5T1_9ACTN|nr:tRNA dimethylallyltransferase [Quadrisphaera granulorum]SZE97315.1 tRNA dimethylallyltransferase [Quadrisphaera granulorum]